MGTEEKEEWNPTLAPTRGVASDKETFLQPGLSVFGIRARQFAHHEKGVARLNHGSFGSCPAMVQSDQAEWKVQHLRRTDAFLDRDLEERLKDSREAVAGLIGAASVDEVMLLDNVTTAMAMIAQKLTWDFIEGRFQKGDIILLLNFAYGAVKTCFENVISRAGGRVYYAKIPFPVKSHSHILDSFTDSLGNLKAANPSSVIRLAVIDHITSMPAIILPVKQMVAVARSFGVEEILIDGAHAIGSVHIDVQDLDADYYTSNLHKWMFTPSTVAVFHCKRSHLSSLHHPIVSTTHGRGLAAECAWVGTRDYSAMLAVPAAVQFVNELGGVDLVRNFNHNSALAMGKMLARAWDTVFGGPSNLFPSMVMVGIPPELNINSFNQGLELRTLLREEFKVEVPFHFISESDQPLANEVTHRPGITTYARVSHQVYNTVGDYECLRKAIISLVNRGWTPQRN